MAHSTYTWKAPDGTEMFGQDWTTDNAKAAVVIVHGMGEHSGRYAHVAKAMNDEGYSCYSFDHRGHGKTAGKKGHTPSFDALLDSVEDVLKRAKGENPGKPVFIYGHSMGGNVTTNFAIRRNPKVNGIVVSSPWLRLAFDPPAIQVAAGKLVNRIFPGFTQSSNLDVNSISRDAEEVKKYEADPMVHDKISTSFFLGVHDAGLWAIENAGKLSVPAYVFHGSADKLTSHDASKEFADKAAGDVTWKSWDGLYHECHNEPEKDQVIQSIIDWMDSKL